MNKQKVLVVVAGPTAVGKTELSLAIAQHFNTGIISADSRQCYKEMSIGTAKPSAAELALVPHYFVNSHSAQTALSAGDFERLSLGYLEEIFNDNSVAVLCGGTGLYVSALSEGIDEMPKVDKALAQSLQEKYEQHGLSWLQAQVAEKDPEFYAQNDRQNPARLLRALSFFESQGVSILNYRSGAKKERPFKIIKIGLELPRALLYERINARVDQMMESGLLEEVAQLYPLRMLKNLQTVGYSEFYEFGHWPLTENELANAVEKVKQHSRNYAKRQLTWFKKDEAFAWFSPADVQVILRYIHQQLLSACG